MLKKNNNFVKGKRPMARKVHKSKPQQHKPQGKSSGNNPTLVLKAKTFISQNISLVNIKQINIAPTLSIFGADVLQQAKFFQQYRISRVRVSFLNLDPVNYQQGANTLQLPLVFQVPMINGTVPTPSISAYLAYKNVKYMSYRKDFSRSFVPYVNTQTVNSPFLRAPRLPTTDLTQVHYGLSFLFTKGSIAATSYLLQAVLQADVQFYSYDGNQGVAFVGEQDQWFDDHPLNLEDLLPRQIEQFQYIAPEKKKNSTVLMKDQRHARSYRSMRLATVEKNPGPVPVSSSTSFSSEEGDGQQDKPPDK